MLLLKSKHKANLDSKGRKTDFTFLIGVAKSHCEKAMWNGRVAVGIFINSLSQTVILAPHEG